MTISLTSPVFWISKHFLFIASFAVDFLYLLSSDKSDLIDDESEDDGPDYGSSGTYIFKYVSLRFDNYVGSASGLGSGVFISTGVDTKCDIFAFDVFLPISVESKVGRLIEVLWRSNSLFYFQI